MARRRSIWNLLLVHSSCGRWSEALTNGEQSLNLARQLGMKEQLAFTLHDIHGVYMFVGQPERSTRFVA